MNNNLISKSKFLSLILRHKPEKANIKLDKNGWTDVKVLCNNTGIAEDELIEIVETNDKKRFVFNKNKTEIRASQGHSVEVDLKLNSVIPPAFLYHGTKKEFLNKILGEGLDKMKRNHVHLSKDINTAQIVSDRRKGESIILKIAARRMYFDEYKFFCSANGVYLTDNVPSKYIEILK